MIIIDVETGQGYKVEIEPVENSDFTGITKKRHFFDWKEERDQE